MADLHERDETVGSVGVVRHGSDQAVVGWKFPKQVRLHVHASYFSTVSAVERQPRCCRLQVLAQLSRGGGPTAKKSRGLRQPPAADDVGPQAKGCKPKQDLAGYRADRHGSISICSINNKPDRLIVSESWRRVFQPSSSSKHPCRAGAGCSARWATANGSGWRRCDLLRQHWHCQWCRSIARPKPGTPAQRTWRGGCAQRRHR